jgi:transketolase
MNYEQMLHELVHNDERIMIVTAENRAAIRNLPAMIGNRFIDTGIAEQTMVGLASGLALRGRIPVAHALAAFLTMRSFEFIRTNAGIGNLPVKLVGFVPGFLSEANGPTHQAIEDISLMRGIPNVNIFCPADEEDMLIGLKKVLLSDSPFYIRYNSLKPVLKHNENFEIGKAEIITYGSDITILTYGMLLRQAYEAMIMLESKGLGVRLINLRTLKPIDEDLIIEAAAETSLVVTLEDHFVRGGLYSIAAELLIRENIQAKVFPVALNNRWFKPALLTDLLEYEGFTGHRIAERIMQAYESKKPESVTEKSLI